MLSEHRDMDAAKRFFKDALEIAEQAPERVTTDGHAAYPRAIRETLGEDVIHRCNPYLNNRIEIDSDYLSKPASIAPGSSVDDRRH